jgi:hypothetical protein
MRRRLRGELLGEGRHDAFALPKTARVGRKRGIVGESIEAERPCARDPLRVAAHGDHDVPVRRAKHLIGNQIRVRVPPPSGVATRDERILGDVHQRGPRRVDE